jgi:hypothetical protein
VHVLWFCRAARRLDASGAEPCSGSNWKPILASLAFKVTAVLSINRLKDSTWIVATLIVYPSGYTMQSQTRAIRTPTTCTGGGLVRSCLTSSAKWLPAPRSTENSLIRAVLTAHVVKRVAKPDKGHYKQISYVAQMLL